MELYVELLISMIMVAALAFLAEMTRFQLWMMERRSLQQSVKGYSTFGIVASNPPKPTWTFGLMYALQLTLGYLTMLVFMTYSVWLAFALCVGGTAGFCFFEHKRRAIKRRSLLK